MKRFFVIWILLSAGLNVWQMGRIAELEAKRPIIIYKADNKGVEIKGRVAHKEKIGDMYTITVRNYGVFVVTQTNYESLKSGYPSIKQIEMIAKTYDVNPAWLVGWIDDEMMPGVQVIEKVVYKESQTARLPDYFNNNNDGKIIKWIKTKRYMGGKVWAKRI